MSDLTVEIESVRLPGLPANSFTAGDELEERQAPLKTVAKALKKSDVDELLGDAEEITLRISRRDPVTI